VSLPGADSPIWHVLVGIAFLLIATVFGMRSISLVVGAEHADGEVVRFKDFEGADLPVVRFRDAQGRERTIVADVGDDFGSTKAGDRIDVVFPAGRPEQARVGGFENLWSVPVVLGIGGVILVAIGRRRSQATKDRD